MRAGQGSTEIENMTCNVPQVTINHLQTNRDDEIGVSSSLP